MKKKFFTLLAAVVFSFFPLSLFSQEVDEDSFDSMFDEVEDVVVEEAKAAPVDWNLGMKYRFRSRFTHAPVRSDAVCSFILLHGTKNWRPVTLLSPIIMNRGLQSLISNDTFSNPGPKNRGIKVDDITETPTASISAIIQTTLYDLYR